MQEELFESVKSGARACLANLSVVTRVAARELIPRFPGLISETWGTRFLPLAVKVAVGSLHAVRGRGSIGPAGRPDHHDRDTLLRVRISDYRRSIEVGAPAFS